MILRTGFYGFLGLKCLYSKILIQGYKFKLVFPGRLYVSLTLFLPLSPAAPACVYNEVAAKLKPETLKAERSNFLRCPFKLSKE